MHILLVIFLEIKGYIQMINFPSYQKSWSNVHNMKDISDEKRRLYLMFRRSFACHSSTWYQSLRRRGSWVGKQNKSNHQQLRLAKFYETKFMHTTITTSKEILKEMRKMRRRSCSFLIDWPRVNEREWL